MTSTIKADVLQSKTTDGDLTISGDGSGVPNLEAGFKVGGTAGVPLDSIRTTSGTASGSTFLRGDGQWNSVETAQIADDAVTLAKMASGVDGTVISFDASGNPVAVGPGTDGQVLTSTGAGSPPAFEDAGGGGAWNLIGTAVASNSNGLTITGLDSTYDTYAMAISDFRCGSPDDRIALRFGDSNGIDSGGSDYSYYNMRGSHNTNNDSPGGTGDDANDKMEISAGQHVGTSSTNGGLGALLYLHRPGDGTVYPNFTGTVWVKSDAAGNTTNSQFTVMAAGNMLSSITLTQVHLMLRGGGTIAHGRFTIWGLAHA